MLVKVPRIFLRTALQGCVNWAKESHVSVIDERYRKIINDKRSAEKKS